jgi:hypothetical protein
VDGVTSRSQQFGSSFVEPNTDLVGAMLSCLNEPDGAVVESEPWIEVVVHHHAITDSQSVPLEHEHHRTPAPGRRPSVQPAWRVAGLAGWTGTDMARSSRWQRRVCASGGDRQDRPAPKHGA